MARTIGRLIVLLLALQASPLQAESLKARIETTPHVARHLKVVGGKVMIGGKWELSLLRHYQVEIVSKEKIDLREKLTDAQLPDLLLQIKHWRTSVGISAFSTLPMDVREGKRSLNDFGKNLPKMIRGYPHVFPYYLQVGLNVRLRIRGVDQAIGGFNSRLFSSHAVVNRPDDKDRDKALTASLTRIDSYIRRQLGTRLLDVDAVVRDKRATFDVKVKNPFPFDVAGAIGLPPDDDYQLQKSRQAFALSPGQEKTLTFRLDPIDLDQEPRWPLWWQKRGERSLYGRFGAIQFVRLHLNSKQADATELPVAVLPATRGEPANLIDEVKLKRDTYSLGKWQKKDGELVYQGGSFKPQVRFYVHPPHTYDLQVEFSLDEIKHPIRIMMPQHPSTLVCDVGGSEGLVELQVKAPNGRHPSSERIKGLIQRKKRHNVVLRVRNDRVDVLVDGKRVLRHETDFKDLRPDQAIFQFNARHPAIGVHGPAVLHKVMLTPRYKRPATYSPLSQLGR